MREENPLVHVLHRPAESVRLCRPRATLLLEELARFGVPAKMLACSYPPVTRRHAGSRAYGRR